MAARFSTGELKSVKGNPFAFNHDGPFAGFATMTPLGPRWTGRVELIESQLEIPLHWRKPRRIFVNSMSDTWHESLHLRDIARLYAVMSLANWHTFMILTKRPENRRVALLSDRFQNLVDRAAEEVWERHTGDGGELSVPLPLEQVWEGVSCEDQQTANERIAVLLKTPAELRFISLEPMLGPVDLKPYLPRGGDPCGVEVYDWQKGRYGCPSCMSGLDWVIVGGESGPGARPMHPDWARSVRDQCIAAKVPFFFKQWGEWAPFREVGLHTTPYIDVAAGDGTTFRMWRVGKRVAGRLLDGREWNEMPEVKR